MSTAIRSKADYSVNVKTIILESLDFNRSILQLPREGIFYPAEYSTKKPFTAINLLYFGQLLHDRNSNSTQFFSVNDINELQLSIKKGECGTVKATYGDPLTYDRDATDNDGSVHKKGDAKVDVDGVPLKGIDYVRMYAGDQLNSIIHKKNASTGKYYTLSLKNITLPSEPQACPVDNSFVQYKAKNNSSFEKFAEAFSKYSISCYTGKAYNGTNFSPLDISILREEFFRPNSKLFQKLSEIGFMASGNSHHALELQRREEEKLYPTRMSAHYPVR